MTSSLHIQSDFSHASKLSHAVCAIGQARLRPKLGKITGINRTTLRARFCHIGQGAVCRIQSGAAQGTIVEVIALDGDTATLSVLGDAGAIQVGDRVEWLSDRLMFQFHETLLGSVLDGIGRPIAAPHAAQKTWRPARPSGSIPALERPLIDHILHTGVSAIDGFLTMGRGQRIALFGPPGCGKSTLLAQIVSRCTADVVVLALVGERGREVQEFLKRHLPGELRQRCIVVVATSDRPAMERAYAVDTAASIAEGFRDAGKHVLLMVDSMTRVARALREIGLSAGEPAVRRGFPASVYAALPRMIERAGVAASGSITAIYAVLSEGDAGTDPIVEEIKSLTDGHIQLDPDLAAAGRFPAIDIVGSLSRVMPDIVDRSHLELATKGRGLLAKHQEMKLLIQIGEYKQGHDPEADEAIARFDNIQRFLHPAKKAGFADTRQTVNALGKVLSE